MSLTSARSEITSHGPHNHAASSRTWQRTISGRQYSFTAILMLSGERRYAAHVLREGQDPRFGCSWQPAGFWTLPAPEITGCHDCPCCSESTYSRDLLCSECIEADCQPNSHGEYNDCSQPPTVIYETIVFLQGDEASEVIDLLYGWQGDEYHCHYLGATSEGIDAALEFLKAWDYGEPAEEHTSPSCGTSDDSWVLADGAYLLSANLGLGYVGLERITVAS